MINNHGRTLSLPVPSSFSSSTEFLQQCVTMTAAGNNSTFGEVGGNEWEILTNLLQRQKDVVVIKPQQEEHLQNRLLLMQLPQSEQGGGGYFNNFHMLAAATDSIEPASSLATQTEQGGGEFVVSNGDDSDLNRILTRPVKGEWPELARFVAGVMTSADTSNETTSAVNFPTTVSCPAPPGVAGITPTTVFNSKETYPPLTVTADMGMDGLSIGKLRGVRRRECFKKRKTEDKALISPPRMKSEEEEEEAEDVDEAKKRARGGCCVQVQQVKKNTDDQQLCKNGNSNGSSSPSNETNRDNKILPGEEVSGCTISKENNNINSRVEVQNQKPDYIHVRARRGQATDSHSLAERVRREKISERMKYLQDLVPGCNKIIGKAGMLDEIINYVQSLQRQVEFLSMKLATVNPTLDFNIEDFFTKQVLCSSNYQTMPIPSEMGNNPGLNILYNPTTQNQTGGVSGFEMVMNEESDHMGLLRRTISAPVSLPAATATADTHQHLDLSYLTQEDICRLSWDNGADLLQSIYSTMEEFHPERVHQQQQQPFSEADYLKMEIQ